MHVSREASEYGWWKGGGGGEGGGCYLWIIMSVRVRVRARVRLRVRVRVLCACVCVVCVCMHGACVYTHYYIVYIIVLYNRYGSRLDMYNLNKENQNCLVDVETTQ